MAPKESDVVKINILSHNPPSVATVTKSKDYEFETFIEEPHLSSPTPDSHFSEPKQWYTGLPITIICSATNTRFVAIKDVTIKFKINFNKKEIMDEKGSLVSEIAPSDSSYFSKVFLPILPGRYELICNVTYTFDNNKMISKSKTNLDIFPTISLEHRVANLSIPLIQTVLQNNCKFTLHDIKLTTNTGDKYEVPMPIATNEKYSLVIKPCKDIKVEFSLPFMSNASLNFICAKVDPPKEKSLSVELEGVPSEWPVFKPFSVKAKIINKGKNALNSKLSIAELNDGIALFGCNDLSLPVISPSEMVEKDLTFIAVKQGVFQFPAFDFDPKDERGFRIKPNEGIIVLGNADQNE